jgi:hypothetical protein
MIGARSPPTPTLFALFALFAVLRWPTRRTGAKPPGNFAAATGPPHGERGPTLPAERLKLMHCTTALAKTGGRGRGRGAVMERDGIECPPLRLLRPHHAPPP